MKITREFVRDGEKVTVVAEALEGGRWRVRVGEAVAEYSAAATSDGGVRLVPGDGDGPAFVAYGAAAAGSFMVRVDGTTHALLPPATRGRAGGRAADGNVRAPMTGTVLDVLCKAGDAVTADQTLVVVSAMKMEHKLKAGVAGVVQSVSAAKGATVDQGAVLVIVEQQPEAE